MRTVGRINIEPYDAIELATTFYEDDPLIVSPIHDPADVTPADHFHAHTVYLHRKTGGLDAIADFLTTDHARHYAVMLSRSLGIPVTYDQTFDAPTTKEQTDEPRT